MLKTQTIRIPIRPSPIWDGDRVFEAPGGAMVYPIKAKDITIPNLFGGTVLAKRVEYVEVKSSKRLSSSIRVEVSPKGLLDCIGLVCGGQVLAVVGRGSNPKRTLVVVEPQAIKEPEVFEVLSGLLLKEGFESLPVEGRIKLGGKPEFEVVLGGVVVPAESYLPPEEGFEPPVRSEWHILKVEPRLCGYSSGVSGELLCPHQRYRMRPVCGGRCLSHIGHNVLECPRYGVPQCLEGILSGCG
jgi:hypothetical protein